jgi:ribosomal protein S18 acetylase RimI-like enzyme
MHPTDDGGSTATTTVTANRVSKQCLSSPDVSHRNFFGIKQEKQLLSVAGVHIYAPTYRIAVLGNIATHPSMRRRGLATQCMTALLKALEPDVDFIGLITRADNTQAIALYNRTGFSIASTLEEALFENR